MAYPGSKLYEFYSEKPELLPDSWNGYSQHSFETKPLPSKYLSPEEILRFRDESFDNYFLNDKYTDMIQLKFGKKVVEHIQRMTKIKLKRKLFNEI